MIIFFFYRRRLCSSRTPYCRNHYHPYITTITAVTIITITITTIAITTITTITTTIYAPIKSYSFSPKPPQKMKSIFP